MPQSDWPAGLTSAIAAEMRRYRLSRKYSAKELADRCVKLGLPVSRSTLADLENGRRASLTVPELLIIARALDVPPVQLVYPVGHVDAVEALPGQNVPPWTAAKWLTGEDIESGPQRPTDYFRRHDAAEAKVLQAEIGMTEGNGSAEIWQEARERSIDRLLNIRKSMRQAGLLTPQLRPDLAKIEAERGQVNDATES